MRGRHRVLARAEVLRRRAHRLRQAHAVTLQVRHPMTAQVRIPDSSRRRRAGGRLSGRAISILRSEEMRPARSQIAWSVPRCRAGAELVDLMLPTELTARELAAVTTRRRPRQR